MVTTNPLSDDTDPDELDDSGRPSATTQTAERTETAPPATQARWGSWHRALIVGAAAYVVSRLCVLVGAGVRASQLAVEANQAGVPHPGSPGRLAFETFTLWDARWYLEIVRGGYPAVIPEPITFHQLEARAAFFPLYPMLVGAVDTVLPGGDVLAAVGLNVVLGLAATFLVGLLARRLFDDTVAERAMVLFAVFPGSFVLSFAYSEALLIVLAALCLWWLLDERWILAGLAAALATASRPNAVALIAACVVASFLAVRRRRDWRSLWAPLLSPIGLIAFHVYLAIHTGERSAWFRVQREAWKEGTSFGATAVKNTLEFVTEPLSSPTNAVTFATLVALAFGLWALRRYPLPWPMIAYVVVVVALMLAPATVTARPRFLFTAFPLIISSAAWWPRRDRAGWDLMLVSCGAGLAGLTALYAQFGAVP
ncbi:MAG: glycosyltransferase family 39 protein [Desertimonas sp.]